VIDITTPYEQIVEKLSSCIPETVMYDLPQRWEKIGDVLLLRLPGSLTAYKAVVARVYADVLGCRSVLEEYGAISGVYRKPRVRLIFGDRHTETVHVENGIRFRLDPKEIMFSSGNVDERKRMATIAGKDEQVLDLFSGIGYFTIPIAKFSTPQKIVACEINPVAYGYLKENIVLNDVVEVIDPVFGDNRKTAPEQWADRVLLGYLDNTKSFLPLALKALKKRGGILHFHAVYPHEQIPDVAFREIKSIATKYFKNIELVNWKRIKSYAPGIVHAVLDIRAG
jgi:tRNA wybutosine-synthesizing protein 2